MSMQPVLFKKYKLVWVVCVLGAMFYVTDSLVDAYIMGEGNFTDQLLHPEPLEIWWRFSVFAISLLFGVYVQRLLNRADIIRIQARTSEKFLDSIVENTPVMVFIKDARDLHFVKVNKAAEDLMGLSRDALLGKNDFDFFPKQQAEYFTGKDRQVLRNKVSIDIPEEDIDTEKNGTRTLHTRKVPIMGDNGNPIFLLGIAEDVTDQIKDKRALVDAKDLAERFLQISEALIVGLDANECITLINRRGCALLKLPEEQLIGQNWFDIAVPDHERESVKGIYRKIMENQIELAEYYENNIVAADGSVYCIAWHNTAEKSPAGEITGVLSSGIDITDRKAMEDKLKLAGAVYEYTNQGVVVTNEENHIITTNPAFTLITGYEAHEVIGKNPSHLKSGYHDDDFYQNLWDKIDRNGHWEGEIWDRRKDGEAFPTWQSISSIVNEDGELTHYVSVFSDITPIKQYQESLNFLAHHDPLTGLPNRLMFNDRVDHALQRCMRESTQLALMFLDLDDFKVVNDSYGHSVGDQALKVVARKLESLLRKEDTVARLGGDEFLILLESYTSEDDIKLVAGKIIDEVTSEMKIEDNEIKTGISIGIAISATGELSSQSLISAADDAMYRAKNRGRNTYSF